MNGLLVLAAIGTVAAILCLAAAAISSRRSRQESSDRWPQPPIH